jgi:hypothetical protein
MSGVHERDQRRRLGAWYTPPGLVDHVVELALTAVGPVPGRLRALDPACGDGRFLHAVGSRVEGSELAGMDIDEAAVSAARGVVPQAQLRHGDALVADWDGPYDLVIGNPPFLNQLSSRTSRGGRSHLGGGAYADAAALFLALAVDLVRPDGGVVALVLPASFLATRDTAPIRRRVLEQARLDALWWAGASVFDASVDTCVVVLVRGESQGKVTRSFGAEFASLPPATATDLAERPTWSHLLADAAGVPACDAVVGGVVGDLAGATAGFRDQFYGLAPFVHDGPGAPLITSGLVDVGRVAWGERRARFAGHSFAAPAVDVDRLLVEAPASLARWVTDRLRPKVVVATQTRIVEAAVDADGCFVPSVPVLSVEPRDAESVWRLGAALCSPVVSAWAASTFLGAGLTSRAIKLSARQVLEAPLPGADPAALDEAGSLLSVGDVHRCASLTMRAYGLDDTHPALAWWRAAVTGSGRRRRRR